MYVCVCCDLYINYVEPLYDWVAYKIGCFFFYRSLSLLYFAFLASLSSYRFMLFACGITNTFAECNSYIEKRIWTFKCMLLDSCVWLAHMAVDSVYGMKPMPTICAYFSHSLSSRQQTQPFQITTNFNANNIHTMNFKCSIHFC